MTHFAAKTSFYTATALAVAVALGGCGRVQATQASLASAPLTGGAPSTLKTPNFGSVSLTSGGAGALHGRVVTASMQPVAGAVVVITETGQRFTTDATGTFHAANLPEGNYTFTALATGFARSAPAGTLVQASQDTEAPDVLLTPGNGPSGVTSVTYTQEAAFGDSGVGALVAPLAVAVSGTDVRVLDANHTVLNHTGILRQYASNGSYTGKFGDYTHWLGLAMMKDTVLALAEDNQARTWVLDAGKLWCFDQAGNKAKEADLAVEGVTAIASDAAMGGLYLAGPAGVTKLDGEGGSPKKLENSTGAKAVAAGKGALWALVDNHAQKLAADGSMTLQVGAGGVDHNDAFQDASALAVDPRNGYLVVADRGTKNVYVYDQVGAPIGKVGQGVFLDPTSVAIDATGRVYVLDAGKKKVYKFLPTATK